MYVLLCAIGLVAQSRRSLRYAGGVGQVRRLCAVRSRFGRHIPISVITTYGESGVPAVFVVTVLIGRKARGRIRAGGLTASGWNVNFPPDRVFSVLRSATPAHGGSHRLGQRQNSANSCRPSGRGRSLPVRVPVLLPVERCRGLLAAAVAAPASCCSCWCGGSRMTFLWLVLAAIGAGVWVVVRRPRVWWFAPYCHHLQHSGRYHQCPRTAPVTV